MAYILNRTPILYRAVYYKNIIFSSIAQVKHVRNFESFGYNKSSPMVEKRFKLNDKINDDYKLIYREQKGLNTIIFCSYYGGWISAVAGVFICGYLLINNPEVPDQGRKVTPTKTQRASGAICCVIAPLTLVLVSRLLPLRIYHSRSQKLFKAVFVNNLRGKKQIETFGEHCAVPIFKRFPILQSLFFKINGRNVLLDRECFEIQALYHKMIYKMK